MGGVADLNARKKDEMITSCIVHVLDTALCLEYKYFINDSLGLSSGRDDLLRCARMSTVSHMISQVS